MKKDRLETKSGKVYEIAGKWSGDFVLVPVNTGEDECLIYTPGEMQEFLESGHFRSLGGEK